MTPPQWLDSPTEPMPQHGWGSAITLRCTTLCKAPLDEWPTRRRPLPDNTHNTHKRQTSMPPEGVAPAISASERPQTHALDRAAPEIGHKCPGRRYFCHSCVISCLMAFWYKGSVSESDSRQLYLHNMQDVIWRSRTWPVRSLNMLVNENSVTVRNILKERPQLHRFESVNTRIDGTIFAIYLSSTRVTLLFT